MILFYQLAAKKQVCTFLCHTTLLDTVKGGNHVPQRELSG